MRWIKKKDPVYGERRIKTGFLLFPKTINNETRWLEFAKWQQIYKYYLGIGSLTPHPDNGWNNESWLND